MQLDILRGGARTDRRPGLVGSVVRADSGSIASFTCDADGGVVATYYLEDDDTCSGESNLTMVIATSGVCTSTDDGYILASCDNSAVTYSTYADSSCEGPSMGTVSLPTCGPFSECEGRRIRNHDEPLSDWITSEICASGCMAAANDAMIKYVRTCGADLGEWAMGEAFKAYPASRCVVPVVLSPRARCSPPNESLAASEPFLCFQLVSSSRIAVAQLDPPACTLTRGGGGGALYSAQSEFGCRRPDGHGGCRGPNDQARGAGAANLADVHPAG